MRTVRALSLSLSLLAAPTGCNLDNLGDPPPDADIYFPTGLMLSAQTQDSAPRFLYVVSSNFDLRYNRGNLQAYDLEALNAQVSECEPPSRECVIDPKQVLADEVLVPSLGTSFAISPDRKRMYVATRTDPSLLFIDLNEDASGEDVLGCDERERRCSDGRRRGVDAAQSPRGRIFPQEPVGMITLNVDDASAGAPSFPGNFVLVAHRAGHASLFYDPGSNAGPTLLDVKDNLFLEPTGLTFDRSTRLAYLSIFARNGAAGDTRILTRLGIGVQAGPGGENPEGSFLYDAGPLLLEGVAAQRDTRGVVALSDPSSAVSGQLAVTGRDPASLMFLDVGPSPAGNLPALSVRVRQIVNVASGPLRLTLGQLDGRKIVAVSCFDGRAVYIVDVESSEVLAIVHNLDGPFELGIDGVRKRLYLADFRTSTVRIIDLSGIAGQRAEEGTGAPVIATLGVPKVVQELQ